MIVRTLAIAITSIALAGCLVTRQEVREGGSKPAPLSPEQQRMANNEVRYQETDEQLRAMNGRIEVLENSMNMVNADKTGTRAEMQNDKKALQDKLAIYEEELGKLQTQQLALAQQVEALRQAYDNAVAAKGSTAKTGGAKGDFEAADADFAKKQWKEAIVGFEKYRSANPNGKNYSQATYKIGAAFHELGMKTEAKSFYTEVVDKAPKSEWAKKAQQRLKTLK